MWLFSTLCPSHDLSPSQQGEAALSCSPLSEGAGAGTATRAVECALPTPSLGKRASVIFRLLSDDQKVLTKNFPFVSVNGYPKMQTAMTLVHGVVFLSS